MITEGLSDKKLKWGYWYVTHKMLLRQIFGYLLVFININLWLFAVFFIFKIYFFDNRLFAQAVSRFANFQVNYSTFNKENQPKSLKFSNINVLKTSGVKYDLVVMATNPNINWAGRVNGKFIVGEREYKNRFFSILSGEAKYIIEPGVEYSGGIGAPRFKINYIRWRRIRNQNRFVRFVKERANFEVVDVKYYTPAELKLGTQVPIAGLDFKITNNSIYDYWRVDSKILFKRGGGIVAAQIIPLAEFKAEQRRFVSFRVFDNLVNVTSVEIKPDVDIFDKNNVMERLLEVGYLK